MKRHTGFSVEGQLELKLLGEFFDQLGFHDRGETASVRLVIKQILKKALKDRNLMPNLTKVRSYDNYAYEHSVNVCMLSLVIGLYMQLRKEDLYVLGIGALLHDVGMEKIDKDLLYKTGALTKEESLQIQRHTLYGYDILRNTPAISKEASIIALQHHERLDGTGYPNKLKAGAIHQMAKIVAVADVFDALLADRPFRRAFYPHQAVEIMLNCSSQFDKEIITLLMEKIAVYPLGTQVQLNTGQLGTVVDMNKGNHTRPIIQLDGGVDERSSLYKEIDLSKRKEIYIVKIVRRRVR